MIDGNAIARLQKQTVSNNEYGEQVPYWETVEEITGFLDLSAGDSKYMNYSAKIQESTHVFLADYVKLSEEISAENSRAVIDGRVYDIMLIDDPMGMHLQLEIYLKYTGG